MRKYLRSVAHYRMKKEGYVHVNRSQYGTSYFSQNWRKFI